MKILLTNDDGFEAEGIQRFYQLLSEKYDCMMIAPDTGRSCCGHAVTTSTSLDVVQKNERSWTVSGTPADCVRVGLVWLQWKPDIVISGVNQGGNLGVDILYSGTVAAAREACLLGVPSMAFSQYMRRDIARDWHVTALRAMHVFEAMLPRSTSSESFWNINLPALPPEDLQFSFPISECSPSSEPFEVEFELETESEGGSSSVNAGQNKQTLLYKSNYQLRPRSQGSDVDLCFAGHATVSRLQVGNFLVK